MLKITMILGIVAVSMSCVYYVFKYNKSYKTEFEACYDKCIQVEEGGRIESFCMKTCGRHFSN